MTAVNPPNIVPNAGQPPEDDFDGMLRSYFKSEMPHPWPAVAMPRKNVLPLRPKARGFAAWQSHLALAASVLLLISGALLLVGSPSSSDGGAKLPTPNAASAKRNQLPPHRGNELPYNLMQKTDGTCIEMKLDLNGKLPK